MRISKVSDVEENNNEVDVKVVVREIKQEEVTERGKAGRKKLDNNNLATEKVTLFFTKEEIIKMEMLMQLESIDKEKRNAKSLYIRKAITKEMFRNGISF